MLHPTGESIHKDLQKNDERASDTVKDGVVTPVSPGSTTIRITLYSGIE